MNRTYPWDLIHTARVSGEADLWRKEKSLVRRRTGRIEEEKRPVAKRLLGRDCDVMVGLSSSGTFSRQIEDSRQKKRK